MISARQIAASVNGRLADPLQIVDATLSAAERAQHEFNALTVLDIGRAREATAQLMNRLEAGEALPLAGVPIVVKDNIWVGGWRITQGSRYFADHIAPRDALCVERARKAGAIVIGIGTCSEFACKGLTNTPLHGITRNPLDPRLTPGGSSGGCSAIVAAGAVPLSIGTDGGGSSRRPPSHCGLVGFKPSYGAIPHPFGFPEPFWWVTSIAPIARDVADAALLFDVMAGPDVRDPESRPLERGTRDLGSLRVAVHETLGLDVPVDPDVATCFERAISALRAAGLVMHRAAPVWPPAEERARLPAIQFAGLAAIHGSAWRSRPDLIDPDVAAQIEAGLNVTGQEFGLAMEASQRVRRAIGAFFVEFDLLICPTTPCVAWPVDQLGPPEIGGRSVDARGHAAFTPLFNHGQNPAISIPMGRGRDGLPCGLQIAGPAGADHDVLAYAAEAERVLAEAGFWNGLQATP